MKEKWLSVQKDCKFKYYVGYREYCTLHRHDTSCNIENCQIFKFAEALLPKPEPEPIKLPTLNYLWLECVYTLRDACTDRPVRVGDKKVAFQYSDGNMLKIKKCEYVNDHLVYHLEDY